MDHAKAAAVVQAMLEMARVERDAVPVGHDGGHLQTRVEAFEDVAFALSLDEEHVAKVLAGGAEAVAKMDADFAAKYPMLVKN